MTHRILSGSMLCTLLLLLTTASIGTAKDSLRMERAHSQGQRWMDVEEWKRAERAYKAFLKEYDRAPANLKASAWHSIGQCRLRRGKTLKAMDAFSQCVKEDGRESHWTRESARLARELGEQEMRLWKEGALDGFFRSNRRHRSLEIMENSLNLSPFGPQGDHLQYFVGQIHLKNRDWPEAKVAFERLLKSYPYSELRDDSYFKLCEIEFGQARSYQYDQHQTQIALNRLSDFLSIYTESPLRQRALIMRDELFDRKACQAYSTATFYEKRKDWNAARLSYARVSDHFPETSWAEKAKQRLILLEKRGREEANVPKNM